MSLLASSWLLGSLVVVPLALYWRPGVTGRAGAQIYRLVLAVGAGALAATIYLSIGGIV